MNYYSHHIGDYRRDTAHLSLLEHGVYRQLLDMYYLSESKIPSETEVVYRRLCAKTEEEKKAVDTVLLEFFRLENGWTHTRCEKEITEYKGKAERARGNGKLGGRPSKTKVVISGNQEVTQEKANHKPLTINQEPYIEANASVGKPTLPPTPVQQIVEIYNEILPDLPAVKLITEKRKRETPKFWRWVMTSSRSDGTRRAETFDQGIAFIRSYFERAKENDFVMGRTQKTKSHETWQADFDYLISESGRIQVVEKTK